MPKPPLQVTAGGQPHSPLPHVAPLPLLSEEEGPATEQQQDDDMHGGTSNPPPSVASTSEMAPVKKTGSRRNPWGSSSYADLITQAISSAPDKRLTLAQIYDWLVKNVPYFHGKGDNISSIGWKVRSTEL